MNLWRKTRPPSVPRSVPAPPPAVVYRPTSSTPPHLPTAEPTKAWMHSILFVLTLLSMMAAGAMQQGVDPLVSLRTLVHLVEGVPFAATLLTILTVHEFGHYFAARSWGVKASLPYFLPLPYVSFLGTLGAVIKIRSAIPHKCALLDIGAAGPLAGFFVAVVACIFGLSRSQIVASDYFYSPPIELGAPLLFSAIAHAILPSLGPKQQVLLDPIAFAGWVGLFITAFNLFPIGQLDGGHITYALFARWHRLIARLAFAMLIAMGLYGLVTVIWLPSWPSGWPGWLALAFFLTLFGKDHPAPYDSYTKLDRKRRWVGYLCLIVFFLCFSPVPFSAHY